MHVASCGRIAPDAYTILSPNYLADAALAKKLSMTFKFLEHPTLQNGHDACTQLIEKISYYGSVQD